MSLKTCSVCGHNVSSRAITCPGCGNPIRSQKPIRIDTFFGCLTIVFGVFGGLVMFAVLVGFLVPTFFIMPGFLDAYRQSQTTANTPTDQDDIGSAFLREAVSFTTATGQKTLDIGTTLQVLAINPDTLTCSYNGGTIEVPTKKTDWPKYRKLPP